MKQQAEAEMRRIIFELAGKFEADVSCTASEFVAVERSHADHRSGRRGRDQLCGCGTSIWFCGLPVLNSMIFRITPGNIAEIGLIRSTGALGVPTTS